MDALEAMGSINQKPMFSCSECYEEFSWYADELRVYQGELFCSNCWSGHDANWGENKISWDELPEFVPEHAARIAELEGEVERLREENNTLVSIAEKDGEKIYDLILAVGECREFVMQMEGRADEALCDHIHIIIDTVLRGEVE